MNTKTVADRAERKELKRQARKKADETSPMQPRPSDVARGSLKRKVKTIVKGQRKR